MFISFEMSQIFLTNRNVYELIEIIGTSVIAPNFGPKMIMLDFDRKC